MAAALPAFGLGPFPAMNPAPAMQQAVVNHPLPFFTPSHTRVVLRTCKLYVEYIQDLVRIDPNLQHASSRNLLALIRYHLDYVLRLLAYNFAAIGGVLGTVQQAQAAVQQLTWRFTNIAVVLPAPDPLVNAVGPMNLPFQRNVGQQVSSLSPLELLMAVILDRAVVAGLSAAAIANAVMLRAACRNPHGAQGSLVSFRPPATLGAQTPSMFVSPEVIYFCFGNAAAHPPAAVPNNTPRFAASPPKYTGFPSLQNQAWNWRINRFAAAEQVPIIASRATLHGFIAAQPPANPIAAKRQVASGQCLAAGPPTTFPHPNEPGDAFHVWGKYAAGGMWRIHRCWSCRSFYLYNPTEVGLGVYNRWHDADHGNFGCAEPLCHMLCGR